MVVDDSITQALNRIAENQEEMNATLTRIADHYDGVVPVMTRNAERVERAQEEVYDEFGVNTKNSFNTPPRN
jgi:hypothetical protein